MRRKELGPLFLNFLDPPLNIREIRIKGGFL